MASSALIGWTGFVGGNLDRQRPFERRFRSSDIEEIAGTRWDLVVCAGMPAEKWRINANPDADRAALDRLTSALGRASVDHVILISTVDVYTLPLGVDERSDAGREPRHAYGEHRLELERWMEARFHTTIVRLPGLFGPGLKKNVVFDLLHRKGLGSIHADDEFQFYPLDRLWADIERVVNAGVRLVHLVTEPTCVGAVAQALLGTEFDNRPTDRPPVRYDVRTMHGAIFGREGFYLMSHADVISALERFGEEFHAEHAEPTP